MKRIVQLRPGFNQEYEIVSQGDQNALIAVKSYIAAPGGTKSGRSLMARMSEKCGKKLLYAPDRHRRH